MTLTGNPSGEIAISRSKMIFSGLERGRTRVGASNIGVGPRPGSIGTQRRPARLIIPVLPWPIPINALSGGSARPGVDESCRRQG